jgi:SAM-dependent methyltransferase
MAKGLRKAPELATPRYIDDPSSCYFYHTMELPGFGLMRGQWDLRGKFDEYLGGVNVSGKSLLDIGAASGFLSFEAERCGARVMSFDMSDVRQQILLPFKDKIYYTDHEAWVAEYEPYIERWKNAYWLSHRLYGSKAEVFYGDIYALPPELGLFDVTLVGSVLEHLNDQISALGSIARLTRETMIIVTPMIDTDERVARFEPVATDSNQDYTWWTYSTGVYREVLAMLGFEIVRITSSEYFHTDVDRFEERPTIVAERRS